MDFVNISSIYHATQKRQPPHYQTFKDLKRENVRDVRDKKRKNLAQAEEKWFCTQVLHIQNEPINEPPSNRQTAEINVKNIKNDKILWEKHCLILGNVYFCTYEDLGNV